jgi:hypothetical protein
MALFDWKNNEAGTTKISASNLNLAQQKMVDTIYSVGSIYKSFANTNPSEIFGGTWEVIKCSDLIESGIKNGVNYRLYSDGYCECWGRNYCENVVPHTAYDEQINLPFTFQSEINVSSARISGGSYFASTGYFYEITNQSSIHFAVYNNESANNASGMHFSWKASGYVTNSTPIYAWKRTA